MTEGILQVLDEVDRLAGALHLEPKALVHLLELVKAVVHAFTSPRCANLVRQSLSSEGIAALLKSPHSVRQ